jgi:hypothetical protein
VAIGGDGCDLAVACSAARRGDSGTVGATTTTVDVDIVAQSINRGGGGWGGAGVVGESGVAVRQ